MASKLANCWADEIETRRQQAVEKVIKAFQKLVDELYAGRYGCSDECRSVLVGTLAKELHKRNLYHPMPKKPYLGLSPMSLSESIGWMRYPHWYSKSEISYGVNVRHSCSLVKEVQKIVDVKVEGLEMDSYL